jgi:hypothetical protein
MLIDNQFRRISQILTIILLLGISFSPVGSSNFPIAHAQDPTTAPEIGISPVTGQFFNNPINGGSFSASPSTPEEFHQTFPVINFNPPNGATSCSNNTGVDLTTRPFTDVIPQADGSCLTMIAQGNGKQAGVGSLRAFQAVFRGTFTSSAAGQVTFNIFSDDGWILSIGTNADGDQPAYVKGSMINPPSEGPFSGFPVVGSYNNASSPAQRKVVVNFPSEGTYPFELDYTEGYLGQLSLTLNESDHLPPGNVNVSIGGDLRGSYTLDTSQSISPSYVIDGGPVEVESTNGEEILSSQRFIFSYQDSKSYAEMMGYPGDQLATEYWFPWYNNVSYSTQLRISNLGETSAEVKVYAGSSTTPIDTFTLQAGEGARKSFILDNGPLHVVSTDGVTPILASERFIQTYLNSASYAEMMGYPGDQLATEYWFPWYNNVSYSTQLRISNLGETSAEVKVYAGSNTAPVDTFTIPAGEAIRKAYPGLDNGPLHVVSADGVTPILASERFIYSYQNSASFAELMGYPGDQLASEFCFPWYNNASDEGIILSSQLRVSNMSTSGTAQMKVFLAGSEIDSFSLTGGEGKRVSYPNLDNGPLCVVSMDGTTPILASERFISTYLNSASYSEILGYPTDRLTSTYWFPWYNNLSYSTEFRIAKP